MCDGDCEGVPLEHGVGDCDRVQEALADALELPLGEGVRDRLALGVDVEEVVSDCELLMLELSVREGDCETERLGEDV